MATRTTAETTTTTAGGRSSAARTHVQRFGTFLSGVIVPDIGAFIAWGLITAFFIEAGFTPYGPLSGFGRNVEGEPCTDLSGPVTTHLLLLLIVGTGGRIVHDGRGGVVGAIATTGAIVGSDIPMFIGAMIMGPATAWPMRKVDAIRDGKTEPGSGMLVNNFSAGRSRNERFVGPAAELAERGMATDGLRAAMAAALRFDPPGDPEAARLGEILDTLAPAEAVREITGLDSSHPLFAPMEELVAEAARERRG